MAAPVYFHREREPHEANVYRLVGKNEDALSYALGHLVACDALFMREVLKEMGVLKRVRGKRYGEYTSRYRVHLQEQTFPGPTGRRDVVIEAGGDEGLRVVVEAKIGRGRPDACQLLRYTVGCDCGKHAREKPARMRAMWASHKERFIVALTRDRLGSDVVAEVSRKLEAAGIELRTGQWHQVLRVTLERLRQVPGDAPEALFLNEFVAFFREHYEMNTYQAEAMVKKVDVRNARIYLDGYMYVGGSRDVQLPLYFAPYFTQQCVRDLSEVESAGVSRISRVVRVRQISVGEVKQNPEVAADHQIRAHKHWERWQQGLHAIAQRAADEAWLDKDQIQLYFLTEPAKLNRIVKGPAQIPPGFKATLFDLLTKDVLAKEAL